MVVAVAGATVTVMSGGAAAPAVPAVATVVLESLSIGGSASATATAVAAAGGAGIAVGKAVVAGTAATMGPVGWVALGAEENKEDDEEHTTYTFDCWKPVLHDESLEPSKGRLLRDVVEDPRVTHATITSRDGSPYPDVVLHNIWMEQFHIEYVQLPDGGLAAHAVSMV